MSKQLPGGYSPWSFVLNAAAEKAWNEAMDGVIGVTYEPFAFSQQIVSNAINYTFLCWGISIVPYENGARVEQITRLMRVFIYAPADAEAEWRGADVVGPNPDLVPGGWSNWDLKPTPEAEAVLERALDGLVGCDYELVAWTTQVVNGTNYCFYCKATVVAPKAQPEPVLVSAFLSLDDKVKLMGIVDVLPERVLATAKA